MDVSIITVTRDQFELLGKCLRSIEKYTKGIEFEMIVIDNKSTKGDTEEITKKYNFVKLIKNSSNRGFAAASNQGAQIAIGKYLLFLNDDTELLENTIEKVYRFAEKMGKVIIGCKLLNSDQTHQPSTSELPNIKNIINSNFFLYSLFPKSKLFNKFYMNYSDIKEPVQVDYVIGAFLFIEKSSFLNLGGFDTRFYLYTEEMDFSYRFNKSGGKVYYFPNSSIIHIGGATLKAENWFTILHKNLSMIQYYQKNFSGLSFVIALSINYLGIFIRIPLFFLLGLIRRDKYFISRSYNFIKLLFIYPKNVFK
jgi:GT2 family glycosyltransferase